MSILYNYNINVKKQLATEYPSLNYAILLEEFDGAAEAIAGHDKPSMGQRLYGLQHNLSR